MAWLVAAVSITFTLPSERFSKTAVSKPPSVRSLWSARAASKSREQRSTSFVRAGVTRCSSSSCSCVFSPGPRSFGSSAENLHLAGSTNERELLAGYTSVTRCATRVAGSRAFGSSASHPRVHWLSSRSIRRGGHLMRSESLEFLRTLIEAPSPSGYEQPAARVFRDYVDAVRRRGRDERHGLRARDASRLGRRTRRWRAARASCSPDTSTRSA